MDRTAPPAPGEHLGIARFTVRADPNPSPAGDLMSARIMAEVLTGDGLTWALVVMDDFETYRRSSFVAELDAPPLVQVGDRLYGLFGHDRRRMSPDAFLRHTMQLDPAQGDARAAPAASSAPPAAASPEGVHGRHGTLSRAEFDAAEKLHRAVAMTYFEEGDPGGRGRSARRAVQYVPPPSHPRRGPGLRTAVAPLGGVRQEVASG